MFANRCDILGETDDGRVEVLLRENSPEALAAQVAGFGAQIDLIDPPADVERELTTIAEALADRWLTS